MYGCQSAESPNPADGECPEPDSQSALGNRRGWLGGQCQLSAEYESHPRHPRLKTLGLTRMHSVNLLIHHDEPCPASFQVSGDQWSPDRRKLVRTPTCHAGVASSSLVGPVLRKEFPPSSSILPASVEPTTTPEFDSAS